MTIKYSNPAFSILHLCDVIYIWDVVDSYYGDIDASKLCPGHAGSFKLVVACKVAYATQR